MRACALPVQGLKGGVGVRSLGFKGFGGVSIFFSIPVTLNL